MQLRTYLHLHVLLGSGSMHVQRSLQWPVVYAAILPTMQIFDSWGGQLPPHEWDKWSGPYLKRIVESVKATHPQVPLTLYANGSGGLLERLKSTGVDVVGFGKEVPCSRHMSASF